MTTIIADAKRGVLVSDSRITTFGSLTQYGAEKLYRISKAVYGEAGDVEDSLKFRRWVLDGQPKAGRPKYTGDTFNVLELTKGGLYLWDYTLARQEMRETEYAIGSGQAIALYVMRVLGKTAEEAIEEVAKIDIHTAGPVQVLSLKE